MKNEVFADLGILNNATMGVKTPVQSNAVLVSERAGVTPVKLFAHDSDTENTDPNTFNRPLGLIKDEKKEFRQLKKIKKTEQAKESKDVADLFFGDRVQKKRKARSSKSGAKKLKATNTQNLFDSNEGSLRTVFKCGYADQIALYPLQHSHANEDQFYLNTACSPAEAAFLSLFLN
jgi:hypothetical protein